MTAAVVLSLQYVLFSPNTDALTPLRSRATLDRAPEHLAGGTPSALREDLISLLGSAPVLSRVTDLVRHATDASPYQLFPQVVVAAEIECGYCEPVCPSRHLTTTPRQRIPRAAR
jgi:ferredoxin